MKQNLYRYQGFTLEETNDTFCLTFDNDLNSNIKKCLKLHSFRQKRGNSQTWVTSLNNASKTQHLLLKIIGNV